MLAREQIEELFAFCEKKYVRFYDVQVELVDHLASAIEEKMKADTKLSIEEALHKTYKSFGIFGFAHVVQEKSESILNGYNKKIWTEIKSRFLGRKWYVGFIIIICLFLGMEKIGIYALLFPILLVLIIEIISIMKIKAFKKKVKKPLLSLQTVSFLHVPGFGVSFILLQLFINSQYLRTFEITMSIFFAFSIVSFVILYQTKMAALDNIKRQLQSYGMAD